MSIQEQNRMLYILNRNDVSRKNIIFIMNDLSQVGIFEEVYEQDDFIDEWDFIEEEANWLFSGASNEDKIEAIKNIKKKKKDFDYAKPSQYFSEQEERVQNKRKELIEKGIIEPDDSSIEINITITTTRYGRSPLHEAIFMRDIYLIKKYLKNEKYLDDIDNNGHTALEMAFYEDYKEALILFEIYEKKKSRQ